MADEKIVSSMASPPPLSDQYHSARNKYALFSALLLAWNFLGLQIDIRSIFASVSLSLPTPDKVPILLTGLVLYYAYRISIEWNQCNGTRRDYKSSQVDFAITHLIGFVSLLAYGVQQTVPQFGQMVVDSASSRSILFAAVLFLTIGLIVKHFVHPPSSNSVKVINIPLLNHVKGLSPREMTVLLWMKDGKTNWEIAQIVGVTERTVRFHVEGIFAKLDAKSRNQAVAVAKEHGLLG
jgi:DNA-binding CsgD family transcriptional regulator